MSTAGGRTSTQRVTRAASRALSDDDASVAGASTGAPSVAGSRRGRSGRSNRGATPARDQLDDIPDVSNKNSKAYGAPEKATFAEQMDRQLGNNAATNVIAKAVYGASAPQLPTLKTTNRLPDLAEEGESSAIGLGLPSDHQPSLETQVDGEAAPEPSAINLTGWTPGTVLDKFHRGSNGTGLHNSDSTRKIQDWVLWQWLKYALLIVFVLSIFDLYRGPLLGPNYDLVRRRDRLDNLPGLPSIAGTNVNRRLDRLEQTLQDISVRGSENSEFPRESQLDYFAIGNGATIEPYLTSPSALRKTSLFCSLFGCEDLDQTSDMVTGGPAEILSSWDDSGYQRWCAPSARGKLQATVMTARGVAPTELVIEHASRDTTLVVGTAPRELELWIQIIDINIRARVSEAIDRLFPELYETSTPQLDRDLDPRVNLGPEFIPVGRWTYDLYQDQAAQTFRLALPLREFGVNSTKVSIRVNSNWGNLDSTCLNRVRLHGHDTSGIVERLEQA